MYDFQSQFVPTTMLMLDPISAQTKENTRDQITKKK